MPVLPVHANDAAGSAAEPLPVPWAFLEEWGAQPRYGQLGMVAGASNSGKTLYAQMLAVLCDETAKKVGRRIRTLYIGADTDLGLMITREVAIRTGATQKEIGEARFDGTFDTKYRPCLVDSAMSYSYPPDLTMDVVQNELLAFVTMWGALPDLLVVDNLQDLSAGVDYHLQQEVSTALKQLIAEAGIAGILCHHTSSSGGEKTTLRPPPLWELLNKVDQTPAWCHTVAADGNGGFGLAIVRNRSGKADKAAKQTIWFNLDAERMKIELRGSKPAAEWSPSGVLSEWGMDEEEENGGWW